MFTFVENKINIKMKINEVIERHGVEFREVARRMSLKPSALQSAIERNLTIKTLRLIANAIGCSVVEFFIDEVSNEELSAFLTQVTPAAAEPSGENHPDAGASELPFDNEKEQKSVGTALVGLVRCPQCGRAIRLFAEE